MQRHLRSAAISVAVALFVGVAPAAAASSPTASSSATSEATAAIAAPPSLYLFDARGFRYQDPNWYACTSVATMDMLNFIALRGLGGPAFRWKVNVSDTLRDSMLAWERRNDTLAGGYGSDPHGWRNALNYFGWGAESMWAGKRIYDDLAYTSYDWAMKSAVRAMIQFRKPVGLLVWAGAHARMVVGYYGLSGDPFAKDSIGRYTNAFTVGGFYLADPLKSQSLVNTRVSYSTMKYTTNPSLRFRPYMETDSPYDDGYTPGVRPAREEWYRKFVIVAPIR